MMSANLWEGEGVSRGCAGLAHVRVEAGNAVCVGQAACNTRIFLGYTSIFFANQ